MAPHDDLRESGSGSDIPIRLHAVIESEMTCD